MYQIEALPCAGIPFADRPPTINSESPLNAKVQRDLQILKLAKPLSSYARSLQPDPNAAYMLVHKALFAAFTSDPAHMRPSEDLLRQRIERDFASHA